jgi:TetR/AcrR family transcriptional regulator, transcriptional repressor for nem operon
LLKTQPFSPLIHMCIASNSSKGVAQAPGINRSRYIIIIYYLRWLEDTQREISGRRLQDHRIAASVNAPKGTFYNYFGSKEELASILVDRQFAAIYQSLSLAPGESAYDQLKRHFHFLAMEPPMIEIAPLKLLSIFAAEAPAIPPDIGQRIADGIHVWDRQLGELISLAHIEKGTTVAQDSAKLALLLTTCWFGAIVRRKSDPSLKLVEDFLPSLLRCGVL